MSDKKTLTTIIVCMALMAIIIIVWQSTDLFINPTPTPIETPKEEPITSILPENNLEETAQGFIFTCDDNKSIKASFYIDEANHVDHVNLELSDGRFLTLPRAISASGARYAFDDESVVFWNKGTTAFITENGVETFSNCNSQI
ncbi:MAG TPA: MliC family protein [Candidatus Paceibacterota bacterium]|jgi:membrane-bound inhibitor of C-type lysozyme|nr:MliC family protein [Candidatus Paceibacterota bacterium]